ncbi:MAG: RibD family protein, partial [Nitrospiria bacterium]
IIPFKTILKALAERGVTSLLIEGGGNVNGIALRAGEVDRVIFYISPKLLCGEDAKGVVAGRSIPTLSDALMLDNLKVRRIGDDIRVEGSVKRKG